MNRTVDQYRVYPKQGLSSGDLKRLAAALEQWRNSGRYRQSTKITLDNRSLKLLQSGQFAEQVNIKFSSVSVIDAVSGRYLLRAQLPNKLLKEFLWETMSLMSAATK